MTITKQQVEAEIALLKAKASDCHVRTNTVEMLRALLARVEAVTSDRQYIVGHCDGYEAAIDAAITAVREENQRRIDLAPRLKLPALADELITVLEALKGSSND